MTRINMTLTDRITRRSSGYGAIRLTLLLFFFVSTSTPLQATPHVCQKCKNVYNDDDFLVCPICHPAPADPPAQPETQHSQQLKWVMRLFMLAAQAQPDSNFIFSPDSLFQALSALLAGASDTTQELLAKFLERNSPSSSTTEAPGASPGQSVVYTAGNALLLASRYQLQDSYRREAEKMSTAIHDNIDFRNRPSLKALAEQLNQEFCYLTHGMIRSFCSANQWNTETALILINSVYFRGLWKQPFYRKNGGGLFTLENGTNVHLRRVLHQEIRHTGYAIQNEWQAVTVPYRGNYEMVLVLPPEGTALSTASPEIMANLLASLQAVPEIDLTLPAFESYSGTELSSVLRNTGLECLFQQGRVTLGGMLVGSSKGIFLSGIQQNCAIKVNELGTEASAITQTCFVDGIRRNIKINFNRPFLYILRHKDTGRILFIGQILHPETLNYR
ncbi:serpin family protein [Endozoicomonas sp. ISHI1]|uniref:serpin family protein n=2 Tax=unclassified Endozoicomonas TaxID=2644528 RepID=UPI0027D2A28F|nr:serpin family protein [Endozoicomonas sp. ISHI1]